MGGVGMVEGFLNWTSVFGSDENRRFWVHETLLARLCGHFRGGISMLHPLPFGTDPVVLAPAKDEADREEYCGNDDNGNEQFFHIAKVR